MNECNCPFSPCYTTTMWLCDKSQQTNYVWYQDYEPVNGKVKGLPRVADSEEIRQEIRDFWKKVNELEETKEIK